MESGPIPSVCPESLEEDVTEPSPEAAATHEAPATVAEATGSAPPPHMIEAASLLQELQDQPREGDDIGGAEDTEADDLASAVQAEDRPQAPDEVAAAVSEHVFPAHTPSMVPYSGGDADDLPSREEGQTPEASEEEPMAILGNDDVLYRRPIAPGRRRSRVFGRRRRKMIRLASWLVTLALVALVGSQAVLWIGLYTASPEQLYNSAEALRAQGQYRESSKAFFNFASRFPDHPLRPEAQFQAALVLQLTPPGSYNADDTVYKPALALFEDYVKDNPAHNKIARAQSLMGILNFKLGRYREAVGLLRDPELRLKDPGAAVSALRTLARAYVELGEYESARSAYLQAASWPSNYSPDVDHNELAALYQLMAEQAPNAEERWRYLEMAIEQCDQAVRMPGIDPQSKKDIRIKREWLRGQVAKEREGADTDERASSQGAGFDTTVSPERSDVTADPVASSGG
jgi:TolA-binding protein